MNSRLASRLSGTGLRPVRTGGTPVPRTGGGIHVTRLDRRAFMSERLCGLILSIPTTYDRPVGAVSSTSWALGDNAVGRSKIACCFTARVV